jgi:nitrous oxidase accessory protein NosD
VRRTGVWLGTIALLLAACSEAPISVSPDDSLADVISSVPAGSVVHLEAGSYVGPLVIDRPIELVGAPGVIVTGPPDTPTIVIESDGVTVRDLVVAGGHSGIHVIDALNVVLDGVEVRGAQWHGILVDDSSVVVTDCLIWGLEAALAQGFEIRNADGRPGSLVQGCRIEGPLYEGLVAHVSHVSFVDNVVIGSRKRGLYITEMSDGRMEGNTVANSQGAAYFCGDMSRCSVVDNVADGIGRSQQDHASGGGHGLVVHYHSRAFVDGLTVNDVAGEPVMLMVESSIAPDSLYP